MNLPKGYISHNQIRLYQTCPKKYFFSYIEEISVPISDKIFIGMVFHAAVEEYFKQQMEGQPPPTREAITGIFREKFSRMQTENQVCWECTPVQAEKRGIAFFHHFSREIAPHIDPMMVEKQLEVVIPVLNIRLRGIIDLVEKDFSITDFKTTTSRWSKERIKSSYLQMVIYKYLFEKAFGNGISDLKIHILYSKDASGIKNQLIVRKASDFEFDRMLDIIKYVTENISNRVFYKNESYFCGFCEYAAICRNPK